MSHRKKIVLVNGLSLQNSSGWFVLNGHLTSLLNSSEEIKIFLLARADSIAKIEKKYANRFDSSVAPEWTRSMLGRMLYEIFFINKILKQSEGASCIIQPCGYALPFQRIPQIVIAQNPYPFKIKESVKQLSFWKNSILRFAYLHSFSYNSTVIANSEHMRDFYKPLQGSKLSDEILYQGVFRSNDIERVDPPISLEKRKKFILAVAEAASHKRLDLVIEAFSKLEENFCDLELHIVGHISSENLQNALKAKATELNIEDKVRFLGFISDNELKIQYREAIAYISMSECESFGIPAIEAQLYGTPGVVADGTAAPEVCGSGACVVGECDTEAAAKYLRKLSLEPEFWLTLSESAIANSQRFDWSQCSRPLIRMVNLLVSKK